MTNLPATLSTLKAEISALTDKLAPSTEAHVAEAIKSLLSSGLSLPSALSPDMAPAVYAFALKGISGSALKRVVAKIIRGEYEIHRAFIPNAPEFAILARAEDAPMVEDLARARAIFKAKSEATPRHTHAQGFNDLRITHRLRAEELQRAGFLFLRECKSHETFNNLTKKRELPTGAVHLWAIDEVWAPAKRQEQEFHEQAA